MITYQEEELKNCLDEMKPLFTEHWEEIALHKDKIKLNPDYDKYLLLDSLGMLHTLTARDGDVLIGYFVSFIQPHMHYKDVDFAINDILFIHKDYRHGSVGYKLFKKAEASLKDKGIDVLIINSKVDKDFKPIMDKLGFNRIEYSYSKYIGED
ncbi:GNAT family N-acetyltransferase [Candidatus Babeliales bacterium]|nr:GNAT family N-acetyltransferase [Candidatus Babeliales bacterium]